MSAVTNDSSLARYFGTRDRFWLNPLDAQTIQVKSSQKIADNIGGLGDRKPAVNRFELFAGYRLFADDRRDGSDADCH